MAIIKGTNSKDVLNGGAVKDRLYGFGDNDLLNGNAGNDTLDGGSGIDTLIGGDGNDVLKLKNLVGDSVDGGAGNDILQLSIRSQIKDATVQNVETIRYSGFTSGVDKITLDFGGKAYQDTGITTIDLTGFGLEDKLIIAQHDGALQKGTAHYHLSNREAYIHEIAVYSTFMLADKVSWSKGASKAYLISGSGYPPHSGSPSVLYTNGSIKIIGLPTGLADSQFVFV